MKIGVIGIGSIGGLLARRLAAAGHQVSVANSRGADSVRAFADEIGATAAAHEKRIAGESSRPIIKYISEAAIGMTGRRPHFQIALAEFDAIAVA